jgi:hypothetical protein
LLCTLRTHQSPGEWQHSLPAYSLALAARDSHPLDFIKWFPLLQLLAPLPRLSQRDLPKIPFSGFHQCNIVTLRSNLPQYQFARDSCIKPLKVQVRITGAYVALDCEGRN